MIVDDEMLVRKGIKTSIDWTAHGIEISAEARHGEDALSKLEQCPVDLIVTDIRMPVMSGIDLAREVKKAKPDIEMVLLSGYEDFHYAAEAMSLGVRQYLLKPVIAETLVSTIVKYRDEYNDKQLARQRERIRAQLFNENVPAMKSRLMSDLIGERPDVAAAAAKAGTLRISLDGPFYCLFVLALDGGCGSDGELARKEAEYASYACLNIAEETLAAHYPGFVAMGERGRWIGLANVPRDGCIERVCEEIRLHVLRFLKLRVSVGVGSAVAKLQELGRSYREAARAADRNAVPQTGQMSKLVKDVVRFVAERYGEPIGLSEAAAHVSVTPAHLSKVFKDEMGVSFTKWLNKRRVEEAKRLLMTTWLKTYEIASQVGFQDYKYFSLMFKKYAGCSPREFRNGDGEGANR